MRVLLLGLASVLALTMPSLAQAQGVVRTNANKHWNHRASGISLPPTLAGLKRSDVRWFSSPEVDVAGVYDSSDGGTQLTLYVYRNVSGDVPVWFDRARVAVLNRKEAYGTVTPTGIRPFTPRGQPQASGSLESYRTTGRYPATVLAVFPVGEFYAKVRASSTNPDVPALEGLVLQALGSLNWSSDRPHPAASAMADCPSALPQGQAAQQLVATQDERMMSGILGGLIAQVDNSAAKRPAALPQPFCREPGTAGLPMSVYRAGASTNSYLIAMGDGGQGVFVSRNELAELAGERKQPRFGVSLVNLTSTAVFPDFNALPTPDQALELVGSSRPLAVSTTWGKKRQVNVQSR